MNTRREELSEQYPDLLVMDPDYLDEAIVGVVTRIGLEAVCYSTEKVIEILMQHSDMTEEEAIEYMEFNMKGAWVGETTPVFLE
jgi:hypothetical protein